MTEKKLLDRDAKRDIGAELLASVLEMKAGKTGRIHRIPLSEVTQARAKSGLSQSQFAQVLGVSMRTLQEWEQGRRKPSGAARALLTIAAKRPDVIREVFAL
ncbi:MAG: helix-turn-helix domain-containing protein [Burkholderiales bacterium]